jgi:hypothetical protein
MDIFNSSGIPAENKERLEQLEAAVLAEQNRQLAERLDKSEKRHKERDEILELTIQQRVEEQVQAERAKDHAERTAIEEAAAIDKKPFVPSRPTDYETYKNAGSKIQSELLRIYGSAYFEELGNEYYKKVRRDRDLFGGIKKK